LLIILLGYNVVACLVAVKCLHAATTLADPRTHPSVEVLDKVIRNLDATDDIALVRLPAREVLRRYNELKKRDDAATGGGSGSGGASGEGIGGGGGKGEEGGGRKKNSRGDIHDSSSSSSAGGDGSAAALGTGLSSVHRAGEIDPRTSKEVLDKIAEEAQKAAIPTQEMEVIEWEQALFRAAKRSLGRSKVPTQKMIQLAKTLKRSCSLKGAKRGNFMFS
jgi:hypothetical protein